MNGIDYDTLLPAVLEATRATFLELAITAHVRQEDIYVFGLYTSGEASYLIPTANTNQALSRTIASSPPDHHRHLRWSPCDWEYHNFRGEHFGAVEALLDVGWERDFSAFHVDCARVAAIALATPQELARDDTFQELHATHPIVLNLFMGDQSTEERLFYASMVNDGATMALYRAQAGAA